MIRAFFAVDVAEAVRRRAAALVDELRADAVGARWVDTESLHLTLRFLGPTPEPVLDALRADARGLAAGTPPFVLRFRGVGFFPTPRRPRVLWVGLEETPPPLAALQGGLEKAARARGLPPETRPFRPHLTLARFRRPAPQPRLVERAAGLEGLELGVSPTRELVLYESRLAPTGAVYRPIERFRLGGEAGA